MCAFVLFWVSFPDAWTAFASSEGGGRQSPNKKTNTNSNPVNKKTHATVRGQYIHVLKFLMLVCGACMKSKLLRFLL